MCSCRNVGMVAVCMMVVCGCRVNGVASAARTVGTARTVPAANGTVLAAPVLSYVGAAGTAGVVGTTMSVRPSIVIPNGSPITACGIKPGTTALPAYLNIGPSNCLISGTPTGTLAATLYTVVARNAIGTSASATVTLSVGSAGDIYISAVNIRSAAVSVTGQHFGTIGVVGPYKWDNFENGTSGTQLSAKDPLWQQYDGYGLSYFNAQAHSGALSVGVHVPSGEFFHTNYFTTPKTDEMFLSYWYRVDTTGAGALDASADTTIIKLARINSSAAAGGGGVYNGVGSTTLGGTYNLSGSSGPYCAFNNGDGSELFTSTGAAYLGFPPVNQWLRVDMYKKLSSPGVADGIIEVKIYGLDAAHYSAQNETAMTRNSGQTFQLDTVFLGLADGSDSNHNYYLYLDDLYVSGSRGRVEICDTSTWTARMHCEIQVPRTWSNTDIVATLNMGTFASGDLVYLYVVDANGNVNANGSPQLLP